MSDQAPNPARAVRVSRAAAELGVTRQALDKWLGEGCPFDPGPKPRSPRLVDLGEVRAWAAAAGKETPWTRGAEAPDLFAETFAAPVDLEKYLRTMASKSGRLLDQIDVRSNPGELAKSTGALAKMSQEMRQCSELLHKVAEREGAFMRRTAAERLIVELATALADEVRNAQTSGPTLVLEELARLGIEFEDREALGRVLRVAFGAVVTQTLERAARAVEDARGRLGDEGRVAA